jgi:hypothetical protein
MKAKRIPIPGHPGVYTFTGIERDFEKESELVNKIMKEAEEIGRKRREREEYWFGHK